MEEEKIKLSEYLQIGLDLKDGKITPEESDNKFNEFFSKLIIKSYIPHKDKVIRLSKILFSLGDISDEVASTIFLEMSRVQQGLLAYCVNLQDDVQFLGALYGVYDAIHEYGLYDHILKFAEQDYNLFSRMLSDMINISHIKQLMDSAALFDNAAFDKWLTGMKELRTEFTPELLESFTKLNAQGNDSTKQLIDTLAEVAAEESNKKVSEILGLAEKDDKKREEVEEEDAEDIEEESVGETEEV